MDKIKKPKLAIILTAAYLALAVASIIYELSIRINDTSNSEFAGILSLALTLPSSVLVVSIAAYVLGIAPGDSNAAFIFQLGLAASLNAAIIYATISRLSNSVRSRRPRSINVGGSAVGAQNTK